MTAENAGCRAQSDRLSQIATSWSIVRRAHGGAADEVRAALRDVIDRYGGAVRRYLLGALRDEDAADELFQEFALRLVRGGFRGADPERGRFRDYVKTAVYHLIVDHQKRARDRGPGRQNPGPGRGGPPAPPSVAALEKEFLESCRADLLARCWRRLAALEAETRRPWYSVLRLRAERPAMRSAELATVLGARLGTSLTSGGVRVMLHRARERFADILLDEVAHSIDNASQARLEQELIDLRLLEYCRPALERRRAG